MKNTFYIPSNITSSVVNTHNLSSGSTINGGVASISNTDTVNIWHAIPSSPTSPGQEGWIAYDSNYYYIYSNGRWLRSAIADFD